MARVTLTELNAGDIATAANANLTLTEWNTRTADIDGDNIREEGLDRRSIIARAVSPFTATQHDWRNTTGAADGDQYSATPTGTFAEIAIGANNLRIGPMDYDSTNGDQMLVRLSFELVIAIETGTGRSGGPVETRIEYSTDAAAWTGIARTLRTHRFQLADNVTERASVTQGHHFTVVLTTATLYFRVVIRQTSNVSPVVLRYPNFFARVFAR